MPYAFRSSKKLQPLRSPESSGAASLLLLASDSTQRIDWEDEHQQIDGFGGSLNRFDWGDNTNDLTDAMADLYFTVDDGIGLSILRVGINPEGTPWVAYGDIARAHARGVRIFGAPWTAPAGMKNNGSEIGGELLTGSYGAWSDTLAAFQGLCQANASGATLYALQMQNEPDYSAGYESMIFTDAQAVAFAKVLGPKLAALSPPVRLLVGGFSSWDNLSSMCAAFEADGAALAATDLYASNQYNGTVAAVTRSLPLWETEWSTFDGFDGAIGNAIAMARKCHEALTVADVNAWMYWWIIPPLDPLEPGGIDNEGLVHPETQVPAKRFWALGNWSKFVRPGFVRFASDDHDGVYITAFRNPSAGQCVIVCVNDAGASRNVTLSCATTQTVTPWRTSSTQDLAALTPLSVGSGGNTVSLPNQTVTTFVVEE
jgi:glucuronoarabinoxylan endo-1,4-beta-xylanase